MIEIQALCRNYGDFAAVRNASFTIRPGEIVGLLGHNGAGKSTIMKMLMGYLEPSSGTIRINGQDITKQGDALRQQMGYLPESPPTYPEMTVVEYLDYAAGLRGVPEAERANAVRKAIDRTDLNAKALAPIATLSRGYKQRVGVAQAIIHDPKILILDEPTNGLDPSQIHHMRELIRSFREHATVILSTHIMQEVSAVCDRVLMIRQGEVALDETLENLQRSQHVRLLTDAPVQTVREALSPVAGLEAFDACEGGVRIRVKDDSTPDTVLPDIARALVAANIAIRDLHPEVRDLETVFAEVNQVKEVTDAA
ncbi:MAG: ABC transporter ATP-binding protein [Gammaproteobacteria bacterium]|nr:MAG: ABC transporter ATP-binding protein [Gammaproteobacteria bacterium]